MDMILAYNSSQYLNFKMLTGLSNKISNTLRKLSLQHVVTVFGYPYKMIFNFKLGVTPLPVFHGKEYKPTAS